MKSNLKDLEKRGFIDKTYIESYSGFSDEKLNELLNSNIPTERTVAIHILAKRNRGNLEFVQKFIKQLYYEQALYTRLEICRFLEKGDLQVASTLVTHLGKIGNNKHKVLPITVSKKKSYPLPRDIVARILGKMSPEILPVLLDTLHSNEREIVSECFDAIGYLLFYNQEYASEACFRKVIKMMHKWKNDEIILWKSIICLSSFRFNESIRILEYIVEHNEKSIIKDEAIRSLGIILEFKN
ncbi:MAG: hypothetical protein ACRC41_14665 [Sarcina sp.]